MKDFKKAAQSTLSGSFIMEGREKIDVNLLIATYPEGVTLTGADLITSNEGTSYAACQFAENEKQYFNAGKALTEIVKEWADGYENTQAMSADLKASGGVKIKMVKKPTKTGKTFTEVTIV